MFIYNVDHREKYDLNPSSFLQVNSCGIQSPFQKEFICSRPKGRSDYQLIYLLSGRFEAEYQGVCHQMTHGYVLYPPHVPQQYTDFQTKRIWVHFTGHNIEEILQDAQLECGIHPVALSPIVQKLLLQLIAEHNQTGCVSSEKGLFLYILYLLGKQRNNVGSLNDEIQDAITFITTHFSSKLQIDELAASCKLSSSHFMHLFKEQTGTSPLAYQQALRIEQAKASLVSTTLSISEIAEQTGYHDPLYFSRVFKKATGFSPKDYRRNCSQSD